MPTEKNEDNELVEEIDLNEEEEHALDRAWEKLKKESTDATDQKPFGITENVFCPTGEGGGVDPTCSKLSAKIESKKKQLMKVVGPTAHESEMAKSFPLGPGYGRKGGAEKLDATIDKAVKATQLRSEINMLEARLKRASDPKPEKPYKKESKPSGPDAPQKVRKNLRMDGEHTLGDGSKITFESGWDTEANDTWGKAVLTTASGDRHEEKSSSTQGGDMEDAAVKLLKRYQDAT